MPADDTLTPAAQQTCARLEAYAGELTRHAPLPGGVIVLAGRDRQLAQVTFGHADLERGQPMSPGHLFEIGSISKVFTALLACQLAAEAELCLDDPATAYLPWLDLGPGAPPATLRALLSHTAGLVVGSDALPDELAQVWRLRGLAHSGGPVHFHYSNLGFQILGLVLSERTGEPLPSLVRRRLLTPMGMAGSIPAVTHADRARLAVGYAAARQDQPWVPGDPLAPAAWFEVAGADGNIAATGSDLARLVMLLLGRGCVAGRRVVADAAVEEMLTSLAPEGEPVMDLPGTLPVTSSRYGLGINVETIGGNRCLTHGGGMVGYSTFLLADTAAQAGVVVLTNADGDSLNAQLLARLAHADLLRRLAAEPELALPPPDPRILASPGTGLPGQMGFGRFRSAHPGSGPAGITLTRGPGGTATVTAGQRSGHLFRTLTGRYVTDHPELRRYPLDPFERDGRHGWTHGPAVYEGEARAASGPAGRASPAGPASPGGPEGQEDQDGAGIPELWRALSGHYRCYSPWYPEFRIYARDGALWLSAAGGVEAPSQEEPLAEIAPGVFRIGAETWLPERLAVGPVVGGVVISVERDGCVYSRAFTP